MTTDNSLAVQDPGTRDVSPKAPHHFSVMPKDLGEAMEIAKLLAKSTFVPQAFRNQPGDVLVVMMMASELQVPYFAALRNTAVINGRPTIWGDLVTAIIWRSNLVEYIDRRWDEETKTATTRIKRKGFPECVRTFSMEDAKRAKLDRKDTYVQYPQRMCDWRAFTWAARDSFADVLAGMTITEEALDMPQQEQPVPMQQPRPLAQLVSEFQAPPEKEGKKAKPAGGEAKPPVEATVEVIKVVLAEMTKQGKNPKTGAPWTLYNIVAEDGRAFGTFSASVFECASQAREHGVAIRIATKPGSKPGNVLIEEAEAVIGEDVPDETGSGEEAGPDGV